MLWYNGATMHELAVTQSILDIVVKEAEKANASRITDVRLVIGDFAAIVDDSVRFYFDFVSQGTLAEGSTLSFRRIAARLRCRVCSTEFAPQDQDWNCPSCGAVAGEVIAGREFYIEDIEVE